MTNSNDLAKARERASAKYGFYKHLMVYVLVMGFLVVIDMIGSPGSSWSIWPLLGWGLAVVLHGARAFLFSDRNAILDAMTEDELRRSATQSDDGGLR